jgi:hypothetical protein
MRDNRTVAELLDAFRVGNGAQISRGDEGTRNVVAYQDAMARLTNQDVATMYEAMDKGARRHFVWVCMNTLDFDHACEIIRYTVCARERAAVYDEFDRETKGTIDSLQQRAHALRAQEDHLVAMQETINEQETTLVLMENRADMWQASYHHEKELADKYRTIRKLVVDD